MFKEYLLFPHSFVNYVKQKQKQQQRPAGH